MSSCGTGLFPTPDPINPDLNASALTAVGGFGGIHVRWTLNADALAGISHTQIYRGTTSAFAEAIPLQRVKGDYYFDPVNDGNSTDSYYYWIRHYDTANQAGNLIGPALAAFNAPIADIISELSGQITESHLSSGLNFRLNEITTIDGTLTQEIIDRTDAVNLLTTALDTASGDFENVRTALIDETNARETADSAQVETINGLGVRVDDAEASILDLQVASAGGYCEIGGIPNATHTTQSACEGAGGVWKGTAVLAASVNTLSSSVGDLETDLATLDGDVDTRIDASIAAIDYTAIVGHCEIGGVPNGSYTSQSACTGAGGTWVTTTALAASVDNYIVSNGEDVAALELTATAHSDDIDDLKTEYFMKTSVTAPNGQQLVGGFGVVNDGITIDAGFDVDRFWVGRSNANGVKPFYVSGGSVYMQSAFIKDASITSAKIDIISADKIDTNALYIPFDNVNGLNKPEDNATANDFNQAVLSGGSVSFNPDLTIVGADGRPAGVRAHYGNSDTTNVAYYDAEKTILKVDDTIDSTLAVAFPAFRVIPGVTYTAHIRIRMENSAATSGIYFVFEESYSDLPAGKTYVGRNVGTSESGGVERDTINIQLNNAGCGTTWEEHTFTYTPSANAKYASASFYNWSGNPAGNALLIDRCYVSSNATAGATWGTDISGQPADSDLLNSQQQWSAVIGSGKPDDDATQNTIFHQTSTPTGTLGDMWYKTDSSEFYQHDGSSWVLTATENRVYSQSSTPSGTVGDLWYKTDTYEYYQHDGATWVPVGDITSQKTSNDTANVNGTSAATIDQGAGRANSGLNASGQITQIVKSVNLPTTGMSAGLNLTGSYMGYYNGSSWGSYIQSNGNFHFGGSGSNYVEWNGSTLTVEGNIRTSATAQRVQLNTSDNSMTFYDSGGTERVRIDDASASIGYLDITGISGKQGISVEGCASGIYASGTLTGIHGLTGGANNGVAVYGQAAGTYNGTKGVYGYTQGIGGSYAVHGYHANNDSSGAAVYAQAGNSTPALKATASSGYAGYFSNTGSQHCVYAVANATSGVVIGGFFDSGSTSGRGVQGNATASSGTTYGGYFDASNSSNGRGAYLQGGQYSAYLVGAMYPFTAGHEGLQLKTEAAPEIGDIMTVNSIANKVSVSDVIPEVTKCNSVESKATWGVISSVSDIPDYDADMIQVVGLGNLSETEYSAFQTSHRLNSCNGLGEGQINVCDDNGNIEIGDFICTSATPGKGQLYTGSDMRVVVAKAMEPVDWSQETETTKMIACIYMCS